MKIKELLKKGTLLMVMALAFTSCDDDAKQFLAKKTFTKDYEIKDAKEKQTYESSQTINIKDILDKGDVKDLEITKIQLSLKDFKGQADELNPTVVTITIGTGKAYVQTLNLKIGEALEFKLEKNIELKNLVENKEIQLKLGMKSNKSLTVDNFTVILVLDVQGIVNVD